MKIFTLCALAALTALSIGTAAHAADDHKGHGHDGQGAAQHAAHAAPAQHGGVVSVVKDVAYELVTKDGAVALYVSDHGKPVDLAGASAKLTLLSGSKKQDVVLAPAGGAMRAQGAVSVAPGTKALVSFQPKAGAAASARFTLP